jgi:hypothetical protein
LTVPAGSGPLWVEATGGTYTDEATASATSLPAGSALRAIVTANGGSVTTMLTPLTTLALNAAAASVGNGGTLDSAAFSAAAAALISSFKLPADLNISSTLPTFGAGINSADGCLEDGREWANAGVHLGRSSALHFGSGLCDGCRARGAACWWWNRWRHGWWNR